MPHLRRRHFLIVCAVIAVAVAGTWLGTRSPATARAGAAVILTLDTKHPGDNFLRGAIGLSVDANELDAGRLSAHHSQLVRLMRLLGPSVFRIGGDSVDLSWWTATGEPAPSWATNTVTPADLTNLQGLLRATGWHVLLGVDLGHFDPARAADEAAVAQRIFGARLTGIEIGNEPNSYANQIAPLRASSYSPADYLREAETYRQAILKAAPGVAIYGPAVGQAHRWLSAMGSGASLFTAITQHYYPEHGCLQAAASTTPQPPTDAELLSPAERQAEDETLGVLAQVRAAAGRPTLIGETGTGSCRGNSSASPTFASALWALDWALRAIGSGVSGLSFHGHLGLCGPDNQSPVCAPTAQAAAGTNVAPQPEFYGLLAASRLEGGRFVPIRASSSTGAPNLTAWATLSPRGRITIAIDNLATSGASQTVLIPLHGARAVVTESLLAPSAAATTRVALGGRTGPPRSPRHSHAHSTPLRRPMRLLVNPASAVIVTLYPARARR